MVTATTMAGVTPASWATKAANRFRKRAACGPASALRSVLQFLTRRWYKGNY